MSTNQEPTRRLHARATADEMAVITRAITLHLAMAGDVDGDSPELHGQALAAICGEWIQTQSGLLRHP